MAGWIFGLAVGALTVVLYRAGFESGRASGRKSDAQHAAKTGAEAVRSFFHQQGR